MAQNSIKAINVSSWLTIGFQAALVFLIVSHLKMISAAQGKEEKKGDCYIKMDNETIEKTRLAYEFCTNQTGRPDHSKFPPKNTSLEDFEFDDKCHYKCHYKELGLLSDTEMVKMNAVENVIKGNMTKEMKEEMTKIWNNCIDEAEKINKSKGSDPCKIVTLHTFCLNKRLEESDTFKKCISG